MHFASYVPNFDLSWSQDELTTQPNVEVVVDPPELSDDYKAHYCGFDHVDTWRAEMTRGRLR